MKKIVVSLLIAAAVAAAADNPSLNGKWKVQTRVSDRGSEVTCTFAQTGNDLSGTCTSPSGTVNIAGKVDNKKVNWIYKTASEANGTVTLKYDGLIESPTSITGSVLVEEFGVSGEFMATQSN